MPDPAETRRLAHEISLKQLSCFLALVEAGSFRAAARNLAMSQPALSAQITKLEATLGQRVALRGPRQFELTATGRSLEPAAREMLRLVEARLVPLSTRAAKGPLRIGIPNYLAWPVVPEHLAAFRARYPTEKVALVERSSYDLARKLLAGALDAAYLAEPLPAPVAGAAQSVRVLSRALRVALPVRHPAAQQETLSPTDLADLPFIVIRRGLHPEHLDARAAALVAAGHDPTFHETDAETLEAHLMLAATQDAACLVPEGTIQMHAGMVCRPLPGLPTQHLSLAWLPRANDRGTRRFRTLVEHMAEDDADVG